MTYALSLFVLAKPPMWRANAALLRGISLAVLGIWALGSTIWGVFVICVPEAFIIGLVGLLALAELVPPFPCWAARHAGLPLSKAEDIILGLHAVRRAPGHVGPGVAASAAVFTVPCTGGRDSAVM